MSDLPPTNKRESFASTFCRCISWKSKKLIPPVNLNTLKWKKFSKKHELDTLPSIFSLLIDLYDGKDVYEALEACRINPDYTSKTLARNDLEYYVPQLTNFMIFHGEFSDEKLNNFLESLSKAEPYFAHLYYWYINSLSLAIDGTQGQRMIQNILQVCSKESQAQVFLRDYQKFFLALERNCTSEEYMEKMKEIQSRQAHVFQMIQNYKEGVEKANGDDFEIKATDIEFRPYISPFFEGEEAYFSSPFNSTLLFFEDLYLVAEAMNKAENKLQFLKRRLRKVNKALPSYVYVPFVKDSVRSHAVLDIVVEETKIFSTKERAPFYICLELFNPQEELAYEYSNLFPPHVEDKKGKTPKKIVNWAKKALLLTKATSYMKMEHDNPDKRVEVEMERPKFSHFISSPVTLKQPNEIYTFSPLPKRSGQEEEEEAVEQNPSTPAKVPENNHQHTTELSEQQKQQLHSDSPAQPAKPAKLFIPLEGVQHSQSTTIVKDGKTIITSPLYKLSPFHANYNLSNYLKNDEEKETPIAATDQTVDLEKSIEHDCPTETQLSPTTAFSKDPFFGEDSRAQAQRIRSESPFKDLKTWRLVHLIVKNGADMKEEQFAVQLISQFDQIFKAEKLKLILSPYEIMSLGSDMGLVEVIKDAVTFSSLKEKMNQKNIPTLNSFFEQYHGKNVEKARKRFCRSLAAYSLLCYFLQIKDRHNGNILLHKQGHILHIDFGFFLSSAPGKGLEFEKKVPFKLLNEYIEVLGGHRSRLFQEFRKLFYKGFMAARKHRDQILILVKMMYSSQGGNLPCFKAGLKAITDLEQRFCPPDVAEKDLTSYCYNLINQSVDNWRARCYDKYQYYAQGILY